MQTGDAAGAKGVPIPVAQNEILSFGAAVVLKWESSHESEDPAPAQRCCSVFEQATGLTCGLGSGNRVWSLSDAAASDRPEAWLAGSVSACAFSGWCRWIGPRRPAGRRLSSRARVGAWARVHEPSPSPAEERRAWEVTSGERRCQLRPATGSNRIQGLSPPSYVTCHRLRLKHHLPRR